MYSAYLRLHVPIWASERDVIRAARKKIAARLRRDPAARDVRKKYYRSMIKYHRHAQQYVRDWRM